MKIGRKREMKSLCDRFGDATRRVARSSSPVEFESTSSISFPSFHLRPHSSSTMTLMSGDDESSLFSDTTTTALWPEDMDQDSDNQSRCRSSYSLSPSSSSAWHHHFENFGQDIIRMIRTFLCPSDISNLARTSTFIQRCISPTVVELHQIVPQCIVSDLCGFTKLGNRCRSRVFVPRSLHFRVVKGGYICQSFLAFAGRIAGKHLESLRIEGSDYGISSNLTVLESCTGLQSLRLNACKGLWDISGLESCLDLEEIELASDKLANIDILSKLRNLRVVRLRCSSVRDFGALSHLKHLQELEISYNRFIRELDFLLHRPSLSRVTLRFNANLRDEKKVLRILSKACTVDLEGCPSVSQG